MLRSFERRPLALDVLADLRANLDRYVAEMVEMILGSLRVADEFLRGNDGSFAAVKAQFDAQCERMRREWGLTWHV